MPRCAATTSNNRKCSRNAVEGNIYCNQHLKSNEMEKLPKISDLESDDDLDVEVRSDRSAEMHSLVTELNELRLQNSALSKALKTKEKEVNDLKTMSERLSMDNSKLSEQLTDSANSRRKKRGFKPETIARMLYYRDNKKSEEVVSILRERVQAAKMWLGDDKCIPWQWIKKVTDHNFNQASSEIRMQYLELAHSKINEKTMYMEM